MMDILIYYSLISCIFIVAAEISDWKLNCRDLWYYQNIRQSGNYEIDVDGDGPLAPILVECDMGNGRDPHEVLTIVHHDSEEFTAVTGFEAPESYIRNITYKNATEAHLIALIDWSFSCQQYIKWSCKGSTFRFWNLDEANSWWVGRNWTNQYYWGGAETDSRSCECHPNCYPASRNSTCNCDANLKHKYLQDSGLLLDSSRLPVLQLRFGDTGMSTEFGHYTLGPLICRSDGHKDIFMGIYRAPYAFTTPGFKEGKYPPPFYRYTWTIKVSEYEIVELVFPEYDIVYYGSYNAIPECRNIVTLRAHEENARETAVFARQESPPYYVSEGLQTTINITFTTCNQDQRLRLGKGFKALIRRTECPGYYVGIGQNNGTSYCRGICGTIASKEYPFPSNYYLSSNAQNDFTHTWILRVFPRYVVELEFNDFDLPADPGARNCTPESGILWVYDGEGASQKKLIGGFCNLNREGVLYSTSNFMTLVFSTRLRRTGNGRGFQGVFRALRQPLRNEIKSCGQPLGMASGEITDLQLSASSGYEEDNYYFTNGRLNSDYGWCAAFHDFLKEFTVDLQEVVTVNGIILQGLKGVSKKTVVKRFYISFSNNSIVWKWEEEPIGQQKIYICDQCESDVYTNDLEMRFNFLKGIPARLVQIKILDYYEQPCLRLEILGCKQNENQRK